MWCPKTEKIILNKLLINFSGIIHNLWSGKRLFFIQQPYIATGTVICTFPCYLWLKLCIPVHGATILMLMEKIGTNVELLVKYVVDNKSLYSLTVTLDKLLEECDI